LTKCAGCGFEINPYDDECGYVEERDGSVWCEKCYANKRYVEVVNQTWWYRSVKAQLGTFDKDIEKIVDEAEKKRIKKLYRTWMRKIPSVWEGLFITQSYVTEVRELWAAMNWKPYGE